MSEIDTDLHPRAELASLARGLRGHLELDRLFGVPCLPVPRLEPLQLAAPSPVARHAAAPPPVARPAAAPAPAPRAPAPTPATALDPGVAARRAANEPRLEAFARRMAGCTKCRLAEGRKNLVFGQGDAAAEVVFVGEGPGYHEDQQGLAFVGPAGQLLTKMITAMGLTRDQVFIANVVKCLSGQTRVRLADGKTERISKLVRDRYDGDVLSVDPATGELVAKKVVGWYRSPRAGRAMFKLRYRHSKATGAAGVSCTHLTGDHKVLTEHGWLEAQHVPAGTRVATGTPQPGPKTEQFILGTLLGDACVTRHMEIQHTVGQAEWLGLKAALLSPFGVRVRDIPQNNAVRLWTKAGPYWRKLRADLYPQGVKVVPEDIAERLTDFTLAAWFLDDGYLRERPNRRPAAEIATNAFSREDIDRLLLALRQRGIECRARWGSGWRIFFDADASLELGRRIAPMTPACLRYKLHPELRSIPFDSSYYAPETPRTFYDEAIIEPDETSFTEKERSLFCIDVADTHTFVTNGGVVHNCRPPENRTPAPDEMATCRPFLEEQLDIIQPKVICAMGKTAAQGLGLIGPNDALGRARGSFKTWRGIPTMITYHPAYLLRNPDDKRKTWEDLQKMFPYIERRTST